MSNHPPNAKGDDRINMMKLYELVCECLYVGGYVVAELSGTLDLERKKKEKVYKTPVGKHLPHHPVFHNDDMFVFYVDNSQH